MGENCKGLLGKEIKRRNTMKMKKLFLGVFFSASICIAAFSQRLADAVNNKPSGTPKGYMSNSLIAIKYVAKRPMVLTAVEFWCGSTRGTGSVYVFANDQTNNRPGALLGKGGFRCPEAMCWKGAVLDKPVVVKKKGEILWIGIRLSHGGRISATSRNPKGQTYFWTRNLNPPFTWHGPYVGWDWMLRLYEAGGTGRYTFFGKGKQGSHGAPLLSFSGWPNYKNPVTIIGSSLKNRSGGVLVMGNKANIPFPFGTVYAFPPLIVETFTTGGGKNLPESVIFPKLIPNDPNLVGVSASFQLWILDPKATFGIAHTRGLEVVIG